MRVLIPTSGADRIRKFKVRVRKTAIRIRKTARCIRKMLCRTFAFDLLCEAKREAHAHSKKISSTQ